MFYGSKEEQKQEITQRIAAYREAAGLIPKVIEVVNRFDGKVYNCRFDKALEAATNNKVHAEKTATAIHIYTYRENSYSCPLTLAFVNQKNLPDGKRIPAALLFESARDHQERLLKQAADIETQAASIDTALTYIKENIAKIDNYCKQFLPDIHDIFNVPYYVRSNY